MLLSNPSYLNSQPHCKAMFFNMAALAAVSIPLLVQLPVGVVAVFGIFLLIRLVFVVQRYYHIEKMAIVYIGNRYGCIGHAAVGDDYRVGRRCISFAVAVAAQII